MVNAGLLEKGKQNMMKKLSELDSDTMLTVQIGDKSDFTVMTKEIFINSSEYLDRGYVQDPDYPQVTIAEPIIANFSFDYAFECAGDEQHEDWKEEVTAELENAGFDFKKIEEQINKVFEVHPSYYEGDMVDIDE